MVPDANLVLTAFVVFCRIGGCLLVIPGFSSGRLSVQARLFVAVGVALALTPMLTAEVKPIVDTATPIRLLTLILSESLKGVLIGLLGRMFFVGLETMTTAISMSIGETSMFSAVMDDGEQMPSTVSLVSLVAVLLIFVTDLHWELFRGLAASYRVIPVRDAFDPHVGLVQLADSATSTFLLTLRIASPFLVFSIIANFAVGLVNKLVPQIPVTFIVTPFLLAGGFTLLFFTIRPAIDLFMVAFGGWLKLG